jgi:hypothetical protein
VLQQGYARYGEAGDRETSLSIPLHHAGHFVGTLAMRVMNVAVRGDAKRQAAAAAQRGSGAPGRRAVPETKVCRTSPLLMRSW